MRKALSITLVLMVAFCASAFARSTDDTNALQRLHYMDVMEPSLQPQGGVFGAALAGTVCFGGTAWDAIDSRWEAVNGGTWTFDTGTATAFSPTLGGAPIASGLNGLSSITLNPFKDPTLHTIMEGWIGLDNSFGVQTEFRRVNTSGGIDADGNGTVDSTDPWEEGGGQSCVGSPAIASGGTWSFYCGKLPDEGAAACFADTGGYGDAWNICIELTSETYSGSGNVTWTYTYQGDTEPGFDYAFAVVDISGNDDDVVVAAWDGYHPSTVNSHVLTQGDGNLPLAASPVHFKYCVQADGAYSDQDGLHSTTCGALSVDNVSITGGGIAYGPEGFEADDGGWGLSPSAEGPGGEWSDIVALADLPPTKTPCDCRLDDSVLVFEDVNLPGHGTYCDNLAVSPVIDLDQHGLVGIPGKYIEFDGYFELPLTNYIFVQTNVRWYPYVCAETGGLIEAPWTSDGFVRYFGGVPTCVTRDVVPIRIPFGAKIDPAADEMQISVGALNYCRFYPNCTGQTNSTPWFDNVRLCVYGVAGAPLIATRTVDFAQDAFPVASNLNPSSAGRFDSNNVKGFTDPEPNSSLGDSLTAQGGGLEPNGCGTPACGTEVQVVFNICAGPGIDATALSTWLTGDRAGDGITGNGLTVVTGEVGTRTTTTTGAWYAARMDTAEQGGVKASSLSWMTAYHEATAGYTGLDTDKVGDLDPLGKPRLVHDIFPDDLFTPGTRVNYYYRARYLPAGPWFELPADGAGYEFSAQEGTTGYYEFEVLPSSMAMGADTTWNCVLYVDHYDGRGAQIPIETELATLLPGGGANCENTAWDRYDVEAPSSQQWSLGRATNTQNGAVTQHLLGYEGILWSSGNLPSFNLEKEDGDILDPWMTIGILSGLNTYNKFYYSGDGAAQSIIASSQLVFLNSLCGVSLRCQTYRDATCNASAAEDGVSCVDIDPVGGTGHPTNPTGTQTRPVDTVVGQGNGCPQLRSFDVLDPVGSTRYNGVAVPDETYNSTTNATTTDYASIALDQSNPGNGATYSTVVEGVSVHYRRVRGTSPDFCTDTTTPINGRLTEVLGWLGLSSATLCEAPPAAVGVPIGQKPAFKTALANFAPNPLLSGATGTIQFTMAKEGKATVDIFDVNGRLVKTVFDGSAKEGINVVHWNGKDDSDRQVASGVYFTRFRAGSEEFAKKMVVVAGNGN